MNQTAENDRIAPLSIYDCGTADYRPILEKQLQLRDKRQRNRIPNTVLIVEHPPVITLGARKTANILLTERDILVKKQIDVVQIRRGGGITAHNRGQLVFYPILHLQQLKLPINQYIRTLEAIGIDLLAQLNVQSRRKKGFPGLWVNEKKIASIGVRVSKFVTTHGMAINIQNDLAIFDNFLPCGLDGVKITSVFKETGRQHPMSLIKEKLIKLLIKNFSSEEFTQYEKYS